MTENKAIEVFEKPSKHIKMVHKTKNEMEFYAYSSDLVKAFEIAIQALEEIQQYRAIGTVEDIQTMKDNGAFNAVELAKIADMLKRLKVYEAIGTIEEFNALKEKNEPKKPILKEMPYSEEVGFNEVWHCPTCGAYVGYFIEAMDEPEQMEYCNECGQHIARDWSK